MHSIAHRSVTIVTILTLIFTPLVLRGGHVIQVLTGHTVETHQVQCKPGDKCPAVQVEVHKVVQPSK